jgi:hypothetical protein
LASVNEVAYGPLPEQRLNLWIVPATKPTPLIIHIHGGGFIQGGKQANIDAALYEQLTAAGVSYASIQYKFQSNDNPLPVVFRGIARAVQFLRHHSDDWNLDKETRGYTLFETAERGGRRRPFSAAPLVKSFKEHRWACGLLADLEMPP